MKNKNITQKELDKMTLFEMEALCKNRDYWIEQGKSQAIKDILEIIDRYIFGIQKDIIRNEIQALQKQRSEIE